LNFAVLARFLKNAFNYPQGRYTEVEEHSPLPEKFPEGVAEGGTVHPFHPWITGQTVVTNRETDHFPSIVSDFSIYCLIALFLDENSVLKFVI
jgi:hypothetical protein